VGTQGGGVVLVRAEGGGLEAARVGAAGRGEVSALHVTGQRILAGTAAGQVLELRCEGDAGALTRRASGAPARAAP
jgi:hypothetical protein